MQFGDVGGVSMGAKTSPPETGNAEAEPCRAVALAVAIAAVNVAVPLL